ncbi:MAG: basic amino acid ABC transporter substrate-binding protein [Firmicutes bacterium]|nr:basic amino acid ABC transporter substrate-binding protein [Bacillota bacterium]
MKNYRIVGVVLLLFIFMAATALCGCNQEEEAATLTVGTNPGFAPFEFLDDDNNIVGFDIDLAEEIAKQLDMELKIENMDFDGLVSAVSTGMIDLAIAGITITEDRLQSVNFSDPYFDAGQVIVVREDEERIVGPDDLADMKVAAQLGTTGADQLDELNIPEDNQLQLEEVTDVFMQLKQEGVDAVVIDEPVAQRYLELQEGLKIVGDKFTDEVFGIAIAKDNDELLNKVDEALEEIRNSGKYDALFKKWFLD